MYIFRKEAGSVKIGILGMQGAIEEHEAMLSSLGVDTIRVKKPNHLEEVDGLIFPGGESTTMIKLINFTGLKEPLKEYIGVKKMPVFGTCAGMILLSKTIDNYASQETLGLIDIEVRRNAFGRQIDSFEEELEVKGIRGEPVKAVFIRAPIIDRAGEDIEILALHEGKIVMARFDNILVSSFHPEITDDKRVHEYFLGMVREWQESRKSTAGCC